MRKHIVISTSIAVFALQGCTMGVSSPSTAVTVAPTVLSITPASAATAVDPSTPITLAFSRPMMLGMEMLVVVHEGSLTGPAVAGTSDWSADRTHLTFTPSQPLKSKTTYVVHLSPNLKDANGVAVDFAGCARQVGGSAVSGSMMGNGMSGMGAGWQPGSGAWGYGMFFLFTTA